MISYSSLQFPKPAEAFAHSQSRETGPTHDLSFIIEGKTQGTNLHKFRTLIPHLFSPFRKLYN